MLYEIVDNTVSPDSKFYTIVWPLKDQRRRQTLLDPRPKLKSWFERYGLTVQKWHYLMLLRMGKLEGVVKHLEGRREWDQEKKKVESF